MTTVIEEHAEALGYHHCLLGYSITADPYRHTDHAMSAALSKAYRAGHMRAERDQQEQDGHFKKAEK